MPDMFSQAGERRNTSGCDKVELVDSKENQNNECF